MQTLQNMENTHFKSIISKIMAKKIRLDLSQSYPADESCSNVEVEGMTPKLLRQPQGCAANAVKHSIR